MKEYRCLIISPGDVADERDATVDVIHRWNASVGANRGIRVEPVRWETHTHSDMSGPPQEKINEQVLDDCDFGIAIFWSRAGTPTAEYASGSIEEVERLLKQGAKVMMYRSSKAIPQDRVAEFEPLRQALDDYLRRGLLGQFAQVSELREAVNKDLSLFLTEERGQKQHEAEEAVQTAPRPNIRVTVRTMVMFREGRGTGKAYLEVKVENHSPSNFFISSIGLRRADGNGWFVKQDALYGKINSNIALEAGNAYSFYMDRDTFEDIDISEIICAEAYDKIGRTFRSDAEQMRFSLESLMAQGS